eukprot:jgi/Mesen1/244/ME1143125C07600
MAEEEAGVESVPTYALVTVVAVFLIISVSLERSLHVAEQWLRKHNQKPLALALSHIKAELIQVGFLSVLLVVLRAPIGNMCVAHRHGKLFLPCALKHHPLEAAGNETAAAAAADVAESPGAEHRRRLLSLAGGTAYGDSAVTGGMQRRLLSSAENTCPEGQEPFVPETALHDLHLFIFLLALVHITLSAFTMGIAILKVKTWHKWEIEAHAMAGQCSGMCTEGVPLPPSSTSTSSSSPSSLSPFIPSLTHHPLLRRLHSTDPDVFRTEFD